ncbi:hypothetical protein [Calothrix sp. 336/3]|nr:hypothetical protein IJ00_22355 [Calothrix sp. 336/3]
MNLIKLVLLACPAFIASILLVANPAQAAVTDITHPIPQVVQVSVQSHHTVFTPHLATSNPIKDQLGCNCSSCVKVRMQLEGKLPLSSVL